MRWDQSQLAFRRLEQAVDDMVSLELATAAETTTGSSTTLAVSPAGLTEALPYPDARQFAVAIDNTTNDLTNLNAYIADCYADGRPCYLRAGAYRISGGFLIGKGRIIGAGRGLTTIRQASTNQPVIDFDSQSDWEVSDLTVESNAAATNYRSLQIRGQGSRGAIHRVTVTNGGLYVTGGAKSYNPAGTTPGLQTQLVIDSVWSAASPEFGVCLESVQGCDLIAPQVTGAAIDGVKMLDNCDDVTVTGGFATLCGQEGMDAFMGGRNLTVSGFKAYDNLGNGVVVKSDDNLYDPGNLQLNAQVNLIGLICRGNAAVGLTVDRNGSVDDPAIWLMSHVSVVGGVFEDNTAQGIKVRARNVSLIAPLVRRNGQQGIRFEPEAIDCEAISPQVTGNSQTTVNTYDGIQINGVRNRVIGGFSIGKDANTVKNDGEYAALTAQQRYGVLIASGSTDCEIHNVTAFGNATADMQSSDATGLIRSRTRVDVVAADAAVRSLTDMSAFGSAPSLDVASAAYWSYPATHSTAATIAGVLYLHPVYVPRDITIDRIGCEVTAGAVSTISQVIYASHATTGRPQTLVLDVGASVGTINGNVIAVTEQTISQALYGGRKYWFGMLVLGGTPTVRTFTSPSWCGEQSTLAAALGTGTFRPGRTQAGLGAVPNPAATTAAAASVPLTAVRLA